VHGVLLVMSLIVVQERDFFLRGGTKNGRAVVEAVTSMDHTQIG
jgi:hypothetical protein